MIRVLIQRDGGSMGDTMTVSQRRALRATLSTVTSAVSLIASCTAFAADMTAKEPAAAYVEPSAADWTGLYFGAHMGYAWGNSNWTASTVAPAETFASGSLDFAQPIDSFRESGSFFGGAQIGYNYQLPGSYVIGFEADASGASFQTPDGISIGGFTNLASPLGPETYSETVLVSGTVRARLGYAAGNWLIYGTGGLAWSYDQLTLTQLNSGLSEEKNLLRWGWVAGAGVETPILPHWTGRLEYLYTGYDASGATFPVAQRFNSDLSLSEVRLGLNYKFGDDAEGSAKDPKTPALLNPDDVSFHGQGTLTWQGYPAIRSPYQGPNSLPGGGEAREVTDVTLYAGFRLWQGAELWVDPELDQGHGIGDTHGVAGYTNGESYKLGFDYPYARVQRYFVRQTIDLGGETQKVEADQNVFEGSATANRLVLTVGKFSVADIFDTNKYANSPRTDFLNWALINAGTFDYAGDAWGYTYGAAAEWYQGRWTLRAGVFDLSATPAGGDSPNSYGLDATFKQLEYVGEIEERHELWGQSGKLKVTGFVAVGRAGLFQDANALALATGEPADINAVRTHYNPRPGVSVNVEQAVTADLGVFARAGWADGTVEPWDFTDIDGTVQAGVSFSGKQWGRPDDRVGIAGILNNIAGVHQEFFNLGGLGILIGDGALPNPGLEKIIEAYYSYSVTSSTKLTFDYQFVDHPAYNTDRGPANVFAGRVHWQF
jgi:high affinity Mn2+ porin